MSQVPSAPSLGSKHQTSLVGLVMRRPISVCILVLAMALAALMGVKKMPRDILPNLGVPVIYLAYSYGGMDPSQMESYLTYNFEQVMLFVNGIEHFESKNIQSSAVLKIQFLPGTDMAAAMAQVIAMTERARSSMPPGTNPPFIIRFDAGSEPVGKLVFKTETKSLAQVQTLAINNVRPLFASLNGVSSPAPFGSSPRTIVIEVDPKKMMSQDLSASQITEAIAAANTIIPSGNMHLGDFYPIVPFNSVVKSPDELLELPLRLGRDHSTLLGDVATIKDGSDTQAGYALVDGRRTIYIPITKRADASTLAVVDSVKENISRFQSVLPDDVQVAFEFDQSGYVREAISTLFTEAMLGAILTGLMVFLFLRDMRSVGIVVLNIPLALLFSILCLWICGQTINIMTLGGLALAVGILVDETTVTIENIHAHLATGVSVARAALDATNEILKPALLSLLCILSVFIPSFFMEGVTKSLFVPLTLAVGFSMVGSFVLSRTIVPILSVWFMTNHVHQEAPDGPFARFRARYFGVLSHMMKQRKKMVIYYMLGSCGAALLSFWLIGTELFPKADGHQFQVRVKAPTGSNIEVTEQYTLKVIEMVKRKVGAEQVETTAAYVAIEEVKEYLRKTAARELPKVELSFEPSNLVDRTMSQGSSTPIEVAVSGNDIEAGYRFANLIKKSLEELPYLRDLQIKQRPDYPTVDLSAQRGSLGRRGLSVRALGNSLVPVTSSSRYVAQNYWRDPKNGVSYATQVQVPPALLDSLDVLKDVPVQAINGDAMRLSDFISIMPGTTIGEFDRYNMQRMVSVMANLHGKDLGHAMKAIQKKVRALEKEKPKGIFVRYLGQIPALGEMLSGLGFGLALAVLVVFLLLAANFESVSVSFCVLSTAPAVVAGSLVFLLITGSTLNIQSFMGMIMAIGVAVSNAILLVTFAERERRSHGGTIVAAFHAARTRLRPILMTSGAMLVGMLPMASGLSEGGEQMAPLGRAVLGGVLCSTFSTLLFLPLVFVLVQQSQTTASVSLDPDDEESKHFYLASADSKDAHS